MRTMSRIDKNPIRVQRGEHPSSQRDLRIHITDVEKRYVRRSRGKKPEVLQVLSNVNLTVRPSEFVCIVGPSGCGKTTLLRIVAGLVAPDGGEVTVGDTKVTGPGRDRAVVFQDFALLPWANVVTNIAYGLKLRGDSKESRIRRAEELVNLVGLTGFEHSLPHELSGGMKQRVGLARALAVEPKVLLMDEPLGSLDEISRRSMQEELLRVWESDRKTAIFVTHSVEEAVFLADRVVVMKASPGRIAEVVDIDLPRPRTRDIENSKEFLNARNRVWQSLAL